MILVFCSFMRKVDLVVDLPWVPVVQKSTILEDQWGEGKELMIDRGDSGMGRRTRR